MGIGLSILLTAAGAVLMWAVSATTSGVNIHTVGVILFVVGIVGFVTSLFFWSTWGGLGSRAGGTASTTVIEPTVIER